MLELAAEGHQLAPMLMDPIWFAVIAGAVFILLGFTVWSFRDIANRHTRGGTDANSSSASHGADHS